MIEVPANLDRKISFRAVLAFGFFAMLLMLAIPGLPEAAAHGGHQAPAADFSGRQASLFVTVNPPVVTSPDEPIFITARFFDEATNENFKAVTYRLFFMKDGVQIPIQAIASTGNQAYGGQGFFYDPNGNVQLKIVPKQTDVVRAFGEGEPQFGGIWNRGEPITVEGPIFTEPGLYNLFIEIWTEGTTRTLVDPVLQYDIWVAPGVEETLNVTAQGASYDIKVRNYYGAISSSSYDDSTKTIQFSMPFDWQSDLIERVGMLHTEVFIPKGMVEFDRESLRGTVNGFDVPVFVDNYGEEIVAHFTISRSNLEDLAGKIRSHNMLTGEAVFALSPPNPENEIRIMQVVTESTSYSVNLRIPESIFPYQAVPFGVKITDKQGNPIPSATYELVIEDNSGNVLLRSGGSTTPEGISSQDLTFDSQGSFTVRVEKINASNESVQSSIQVVPEFPVAALAASIGIAGAVVYSRFRGFLTKS